MLINVNRWNLIVVLVLIIIDYFSPHKITFSRVQNVLHNPATA